MVPDRSRKTELQRNKVHALHMKLHNENYLYWTRLYSSHCQF
ncbi:hypothetical protein CIPAW_06G168200 [Carya illinoinensis]|uniref:Uncharacterized protein n=1 Tax=Carya illinoinensis TaxID=32201 RepID=A0A8T1QCR2_CARIL|nr:hypothetical protein CIPAW_06G168200 [Carya illinoinensis]